MDTNIAICNGAIRSGRRVHIWESQSWGPIWKGKGDPPAINVKGGLSGFEASSDFK